jgi:hypothetical protein
VRFPGKKKRYLHGGATPEEVIVPTALYKLVKVALKDPTARFLNLDLDKETAMATFYIQRLVTLELEMQNPNTNDIRVSNINILSPETDLKDYRSPIVKAEGAGVLSMDCYFKKAALKQKKLEIEVLYDVAGEERTLTVALASEFKSATTGGLSLKDLV